MPYLELDHCISQVLVCFFIFSHHPFMAHSSSVLNAHCSLILDLSHVQSLASGSKSVPALVNNRRADWCFDNILEILMSDFTLSKLFQCQKNMCVLRRFIQIMNHGAWCFSYLVAPVKDLSMVQIMYGNEYPI